jgi:hypothetical protein
MPKFLIEVPHESDAIACAQAIQILLSTGSHFLTNADFGCHDGVHKAWITVEVDSKEEARAILPAVYQREATIIELNKFTLKEIDTILSQHRG